ncbi:MAG: hypothetical protein ACYDHH_31790 [Solirubrobacteraceae bacterium]
MSGESPGERALLATRMIESVMSGDSADAPSAALAALAGGRPLSEVTAEGGVAPGRRGRGASIVQAASQVGLPMVAHYAFAFLCDALLELAQQIRAGAVIGLRPAHALTQCLRVDPEISSDVSDRTLRLQSESNATVHQLIGVLLRSWHERGVPLPRTEILSVKPGLPQ